MGDLIEFWRHWPYSKGRQQALETVIEIERLRDDNAAYIALSHVAQGDIKRLQAELKQANAVVEVVKDHYCLRLERGMVCLVCNALAALETDNEATRR